MHLDPFMPTILAVLLVVFCLSFVLKRLGQSGPIASTIAGIVIGASGFGFLTNVELVSRIGSFGVILLLFYIGLEVKLKDLIDNWRLAVIGTFIQIFVSVLVVTGLGFFLDWSLSRSLLLGFVISLSSTALCLDYLQARNLLQSSVGRDVVTVLLSQDVAVVPMMIILGFLGASQEKFGFGSVILQMSGGLILAVICYLIFRHQDWLSQRLRIDLWDRELQLYFALLFGLSLSVLTAFFGISSALGAFAAGLLIAIIGHEHAIREAIEPFKLVFVSLFFISVGLMVDLSFFWHNYMIILSLSILALLTNTLINALILRMLQRPWLEAWQAGAILAQIGEFSFVLAALGLSSGIIKVEAYYYAIATIACTMLLTPFWITMIRGIVQRLTFGNNASIEPT